MSEQTTETKTEPSADFKKLSDEFSSSLKNITENLSSLNEKVDTQAEAIKNVGKKEEKRDYTSDLFLDDDQKIEKVVNAKLEAARKQDSEREKAKLAYKDSCEEWDRKAFQEIPQLNDPAVQKIVQEEMGKIPHLGIDPATNKKLYPADALYNAAYRAKAKHPKIFDEPHESLDFGNYNKNIKGATITEAQREIAARLGVSEDRAKEIYKGWNERKASRRSMTR